MWRLLIVMAVALLPLGLSRLAQEPGVRGVLAAWLPRAERPAVFAGAYGPGYARDHVDGRRGGRPGGFPVERDVAELPER